MILQSTAFDTPDKKESLSEYSVRIGTFGRIHGYIS